MAPEVAGGVVIGVAFKKLVVARSTQQREQRQWRRWTRYQLRGDKNGRVGVGLGFPLLPEPRSKLIDPYWRNRPSGIHIRNGSKVV